MLKRLSFLILCVLALNAVSMVSPSTTTYAAPYFATTPLATKAAEKVGYKKTSYTSNGQAVYEATKSAKVKGLPYITPDVDSHNGGAWKAALTVADLGNKKTRLGTFNEDLSKRIGD